MSRSGRFSSQHVRLDDLDQWGSNLRIPSRRRGERTGQLSDLFDHEVLAELEYEFSNSSTVLNSLSTQEFRLLLSKYIPLSLVDDMYRSIDVNDVGYINYSDFTNYLIASEEGTAYSSRTYATRLVLSVEQEENATWRHKDMIECMIYVKKPCAMIITGGRDGQLSLWNAETLELITHIDHRDKNSVYQEELKQGMHKLLRAKCAKMAMDSETRKQNTRVAITCLSPVLNTGLLCVGSADGGVTIYDIATQDVCGRYKGMEFVPTCIECFYRKQSYHYSDSNTAAPFHNLDLPIPHIAIGDTEGGVTIIKLHAEFGLSTEVGMKKKNQILFSQAVEESTTRFKALDSWITQMRFLPETDALVAACADGVIYFVDAVRGVVVREFNNHVGTKIGVRTFSWSPFGKYIVSAADRIVLFWDLFTLETVFKIENLKSPVVSVDVQDEQNKIFAVLMNKTIYMWHNVTYELLQTVSDPTFYKPVNTVTALAFSPDLKILFSAGHKITSWTLERAAEAVDADLREDLCCALYNSVFNQVVLVQSLGTVRIYQAESGEVVRRFSVLPINTETGAPNPLVPDPVTGQVAAVVKAACFDKMQGRLIVTSHDLSVQFWNINDGSPLLQVAPQLFSTTLAHVYMHQPKAISSLNFEITYTGSSHRHGKKWLLLGTDHGNLCGYQEVNSVIEECPTFFLRLTDFAPMEHVVKHGAVESDDHTGKLNKFVSGLVQNKRTGSVVYESAAHIGADPHHQHQHQHHHLSHGHGHGVGHSHGHRPLHVHTAGHHQPAQHPPRAHAPHHDLLGPHGGQYRQEEDSVATASHVGEIRENSSAVTSGSEALKHSAENAILWVQLVEGSHVLMVGYQHGLVALWDIEQLTRLHDLPMHQFGPVLVAMRTRESLKQAQTKHALLSRYKRPLFEQAFSTLLNLNQPAAAGDAATSLMPPASPTALIARPPSAVDGVALPASLSKSLSSSVNLIAPAVPRVPSPTSPREGGGKDAAGTRSASPAATAAGRKSIRDSSRPSSRGPDDETREAVAAAVLAFPRLTIGGSDEASASKLLTGSRTRKPSMLKLSAQRISTIRRASAMLMSGRVFGPPATSQDTEDDSSERNAAPLRGARTSSIDSTLSDDTTDAVGAMTQDGTAVPTTTIPGAGTMHPFESLPEDATNTGVAPHMPLCPPPRAGLVGAGSKRRDSAAVALSGMDLSRLRRGVGAHRKLSVALNPYRQPPGLAVVGSMASSRASVVSERSSHDTMSKGRRLREGLDVSPHQRSEESLEAASASITMEPSSSVVTADTSLLQSDTHDTVTQGTAQEHPSNLAPEEPVKIIVDSLVVLPKTQVIVGACSDKYVRFWDTETHHILCSCLYYHVPEPPAEENPAGSATAPTLSASPQHRPHVHKRHHSHHHYHHGHRPSVDDPEERARHMNFPPSHANGHQVPADEVLRILKVSDSEDLLIGAYDTGMVRTWSIQAFSLVTLKGLLMKYLTAKAAANSGAADKAEADVQTGGMGLGLGMEAGPSEDEASNPFGSAGGALNFGFGAMAMSPITLMQEWQAHSSPFVSLEYIWFDKKARPTEESAASALDSFLTSPDGSPGKRGVRFGPGTGGEVGREAALSPPKSAARTLRGAALMDHLDSSAPVGGVRAVSAPRAPQPRTPAGLSSSLLGTTSHDGPAQSPQSPGWDLSATALAPLKQHTARAKRERNSDMGNDILEGYVMTAGLDQRVYLWSLAGKCVGMFGAYGWEIDNEASWFKGLPSDLKAKEHALKAQIATHSVDASRTLQDSTKASNIQKDTVLVRSPSTILIHNMGKPRAHTSKQLNDYVEALCRKIGNKPPVYLDGDAHFHSIMTNHPIAKISRGANGGNKQKK